ncbi:hypothetical protein GO495_21585 [Chitinophaga oryziterrae]|uniref:Toxin-antitoxin system YwqK family antitoxin n=1 Tax=Chitinophaga oryziterrae TaxID=1031224 RepID=A0A6N8JE20_9BACT|nr:hypothetical protein [Chitinophaga oryziterrae]MVT43204.1 hypothetical protein [Chitinophaga oryziterrae]
MKILLVFALMFGFINCTVAQTKVNLCRSYIFLDVLQRGLLLKEEPDTITRKESEIYYLRVLLKSCKGSMYIERRLVSNDNIVFSGSYMDAVKLDTVHGWAVDPATGVRSRSTSTQFSPLRTGVWKYYNDKGGLLKEEEYANGKLVAPEE